MRRLGLLVVTAAWGCGPIVQLPEEGTTTMPEDEDDDDDSTTSLPGTSSLPGTTAMPGTTAVPTTTSPTTLTTTTETTGPLADCVDLELVGGPIGSGITAGTNAGRGDDFSLCGQGDGEDYVIAWTAASAGLYHFQLAGSDYDTLLGIFPPECGGPPHGCNDDCLDLASSVDYVADAGESIYIVVDGFDGQTGNFVLTIGKGPGVCEGYGSTGPDSGGFIVTSE